MEKIQLQDLLMYADKAISCLAEAGTGKKHDHSYARGRTMSSHEIHHSLDQACHWMRNIKGLIEREIMLSKANEEN